MKKQALLALMLALTLLLTGCTLIQKDPEVDAKTEILRMGDQVVTKGEFLEEVNYQLNYTAYINSLYGYRYDPTSAENIEKARTAALDNYKRELVMKARIAELGLDKLTEEEQAKVQANAEETYKSNVDYIVSSNYADEDISDEEKTEKAKAYLEERKYNMESALRDAEETLLSDKLRQELIKDVTVTDEDIQKDYEEKVASARETYGNNTASWTTAANNGTTLYYTPGGVRFVKQILVKFTSEDQTKINETKSTVTAANSRVTEAESKADDAQAILDDAEATEEEKAAAQTDLDAAKAELESAKADAAAAETAAAEALEAAFANIDAAADGILDELKAGADWDTLMADRTEDPGMQSGITAERGYAVSADMTSFDSAFVQAAMALEKIGDVSGKIRGESYGYYIIKYVGDAVEGDTALSEVRDTIESSLLSTKQTETYNSAIQALVDAAQFKVDLGALDN